MQSIDDKGDYIFDPGQGTCKIERKEKKISSQSVNADYSVETILQLFFQSLTSFDSCADP